MSPKSTPTIFRSKSTRYPDGHGSARASRTRYSGEAEHTHRTAKVIELVGTSRVGFEDAIQCALHDAAQTTRGITGCEVLTQSVRCTDGQIEEYKVNLK